MTTDEQTNLPALIDKAANRLLEARTSGELLEAHDVAKFALSYARIHKVAIETQGDCLKMIIRAEIRLADVIDEGQANGQVAISGNYDPRPEGVVENQLLTFAQIGVDDRRVNENSLAMRIFSSLL